MMVSEAQVPKYHNQDSDSCCTKGWLRPGPALDADPPSASCHHPSLCLSVASWAPKVSNCHMEAGRAENAVSELRGPRGTAEGTFPSLSLQGTNR